MGDSHVLPHMGPALHSPVGTDRCGQREQTPPDRTTQTDLGAIGNIVMSLPKPAMAARQTLYGLFETSIVVRLYKVGPLKAEN